MIPRHLAILLLKQWGQAEIKETKSLDYPSVSPTFKMYQSGYRKTVVLTEEDRLVEQTGMAVNALHPALRRTLRLEFIDQTKKIPRRARDMAIDSFRRSFSATPESGSSPSAGS
jgi:hypothetical protein